MHYIDIEHAITEFCDTIDSNTLSNLRAQYHAKLGTVKNILASEIAGKDTCIN